MYWMVKYFNLEGSNRLTQALNEINTVAENHSCFRGTPYYWAEASLPFAYALACVEVVSESSERAGVLYNLLGAKIYYHRTNIGMSA